MELTKDTPVSEADNTHPDDPYQTGSGSPSAPGGESAATQSVGDMSQGGESYPGPRAGGESDKTGEKA